MIDRRDISYTQGSYLSPVVNGELMQTAPTVDVDPGHYVSSTDPAVKPGSKYVAPQPRLKAIDPFENWAGRMGGVGGLTFPMVWEGWAALLGSAEQQQEYGLRLLGGSTEYIERIGLIPKGSTGDILDIPTVDFPGSETPLLPLLDVAIPGSGDAVANFFNLGGSPGRAAAGGSAAGGLLAGASKILLIGAVAIGGLYLVGKWIGRGKK